MYTWEWYNIRNDGIFDKVLTPVILALERLRLVNCDGAWAPWGTEQDFISKGRKRACVCMWWWWWWGVSWWVKHLPSRVKT